PHPPHGEGGGDPEIPLPSRHPPGGAPSAAERSLGLQRQRHHAHAGDSYLPPAPEDRARSGQRPPAGDRGRRLPARPAGSRAGRLKLSYAALASDTPHASKVANSLAFASAVSFTCGGRM